MYYNGGQGSDLTVDDSVAHQVGCLRGQRDEKYWSIVLVTTTRPVTEL